MSIGGAGGMAEPMSASTCIASTGESDIVEPASSGSAPLAEAAGNTTEWPLALPVVIGAALLAAVAALAAYQASRSRSASRR